MKKIVVMLLFLSLFGCAGSGDGSDITSGDGYTDDSGITSGEGDTDNGDTASGEGDTDNGDTTSGESEPYYVSDISGNVILSLDPDLLLAYHRALKEQGEIEKADRLIKTYNQKTGKILPEYIKDNKNVTSYPKSYLIDVHVSSFGWKTYSDKEVAGVTDDKRIEAIRLRKIDNGTNYPNLSLRAHVESDGWHSLVGWGEICGTTGQSKRLEAFSIKSLTPGYTVLYKAKLPFSGGWTLWQSNGLYCGTIGFSHAMTFVRIHIFKN